VVSEETPQSVVRVGLNLCKFVGRNWLRESVFFSEHRLVCVRLAADRRDTTVGVAVAGDTAGDTTGKLSASAAAEAARGKGPNEGGGTERHGVEVLLAGSERRAKDSYSHVLRRFPVAVSQGLPRRYA
jgi:hypothetical protein